MPTTFSVLEVAQHIGRKVREAWASQFWVRGEVSGFRQRARGGQFFDLVETDEDGRVVAALNVSVPPSKWRLVQRRLEAVGQPLTNGLHVRIKAQMGFYVPHGRLSLTLSDIDPEHTAGAIALARRTLLEQMEADGTRRAQRSIPTPRLPLRLGLITAADSQAFHDLVHELRRAELPFRVTHVASRVQGPHAPGQLIAALKTLDARPDVDLILLTRGGGAEVDLLTFDTPDVARAVAGCRHPVWTGIGHHLDSPVAEQVAARGLKTPTALAQAIVDAVLEAEGATEHAWTGIQQQARRRLQRAAHHLDAASGRTRGALLVLHAAQARLRSATQHLHTAASRVSLAHRHDLEGIGARLRSGSTEALRRATSRLEHAQTTVDLSDPARLLARGWSLTTDEDDRLVTGPVPAGTTLQTTTRGGTIRSTVIQDRATTTTDE